MMYCGGIVAWFTLALSFLFSTAVLAAPADSSFAAAVKVGITAAPQKYVVAHFMVGIVPNYVVADWEADMAYAQEIGIDAFALNCASVDWYTPLQLANAYEAAAQVGFLVFISFDFSYWNNGDTAQITSYMNQYAAHPAQMQYNGGAVVSTFVGDSFDWGPVKAGTNHKIFAIPNQIDPSGATYLKTNFDGVFSWYAWPTTGNNAPSAGPMTTVWDNKFLSSLAGRPYMASLSPWFSPHFSNKNWVFACEELITDRWNQMLTMKPNIIQVVSWNDYGEGHYIGPWAPNHSDDGSAQWAADFPHDGWRIIMKPYIAAYKSGASTPSVTKEQLVYWYRPTPKNTVCSSDTVPPSKGIEFLADDVFVTTLLTTPATLVVTSGTKAPVSINVPAGIITSNIPMGVGVQSFVVKRNGVTILSGVGGRNIVNTCAYYNFNAYVGSVNSTTIPYPTSSSSTTLPASSSTSVSILSTTSLTAITSSISSFASTLSVTSFYSSDPVISSTSSIPVSSTISEPSVSSSFLESSTLSSLSPSMSSQATSTVGSSSTPMTLTSTPIVSSSSVSSTLVTTSKPSSSALPTSLKTTTILSSTLPSVSKTTTKLISITTKTSSLTTSIKTTAKPSSSVKTTTKASSSPVKTTTKISSVIKTTTKLASSVVKTTAKTTSVSKTTAKPASSTIKTSVKTTSVIKTTTKPVASTAKTTAKITAKTTSVIKTTAKPLSSTKTAAKTTSVVKTSTKSTLKAASPTGSQVCVAGSALDGHKALCEFTCRYAYCPAGPCTCTKYGAAVKPPTSTGKKGKPKTGLDSSYLGLCSFGCDKGFCPSATCVSS